MAETRVIAFATQKGGAGKSTISTHVASALAYLYGYKVAMLDCDYPQNTIHTYRAHEQGRLASDQAWQDRLMKQGVAPYPVAVANMEKAADSIDALMEKHYDFILVDTPGTVNVLGLPELLERVDYIFLPMEPDMGTIASTMSYMQILSKFTREVNEDSDLVGFYAFWNKYLKSEKKDIYAKTTQLFQERGFPLLNSRVESLVSIKEKRSTLFPMPERELAKLGLGRLVMEILTIILGTGQTTPTGKPVEFEPVRWAELETAAPVSDETEE